MFSAPSESGRMFRLTHLFERPGRVLGWANMSGWVAGVEFDGPLGEPITCWSMAHADPVDALIDALWFADQERERGRWQLDLPLDEMSNPG